MFSIGASRNNSDPTYKIYLNALDRAAVEGWNTRAASIRGGGNFVGAKYLNVGQNTLYLQKFAVYNTDGELFWHQYMQNLFGAKNEANILYNSYKYTNIQYSKNFQFLIPVYENMPVMPCSEPGAKYNGYMTSSEFKKITASGNILTGDLVVQEWLNGVTQVQPTKNPRVFLHSTDNTTIIECNVKYVEPYVYNFSIDINNINILKDYYVEVKCGNNNNISNHVVVKIEFKDNYSIGKINGYNAVVNNSLLKFSYNG